MLDLYTELPGRRLRLIELGSVEADRGRGPGQAEGGDGRL